LGVNATYELTSYCATPRARFQWAPTLGGECYVRLNICPVGGRYLGFQWAPTLGGECYDTWSYRDEPFQRFQWAPTLGGECYIPQFGVERRGL